MTGTDEHGLKIQKASREKGMEPLAFCDELSQYFRNLASKANISYTRFSRTTEQDHINAVQRLWRGLDAKGLIYKGSHEGWYSISDECFYTDKQVSRVPAASGSEEHYISSETGTKVEWTHEENYKFRLSAFRESLLAHFQTHPEAIFPEQYHAEVIATLSGPIDDLSVSRPSSRLSWGIPVPNDTEHTIYVWIDALTVYLSASGYPWSSAGGSGLGTGWPPNAQIIGKDILRFHAIYLPAMLQALGIPLTHQLLTHSHWTVDQRKMSKSLGNVADPIEAIDEFGVDVVRYYLARIGGKFKDDVDWSHSQVEKHAREITSLLGNLYMRITSRKIKQRAEDAGLSGAVRTLANSADKNSSVHALLTKTESLRGAVQGKMDGLLIADALDDIIAALAQANQVMTETAPWAPSTSPATVAAVYEATLETLRVCGILLQPFMPSKAEMLLDALGVEPGQRTMEYAELGKGAIGEVRSVRLFDVPKSKAGSE
ncbi:hypothetical protein NM688_g3375 [Phlebia brevispora]|uniref:Uncharacterized protein n=1 Tax=Phlebia brevispora TaxID=194682 RepID=A0ACC1T5Q7_9APHY|nr:hypothetical protein NM688_g3375 [Phlebia brevispora]